MADMPTQTRMVALDMIKIYGDGAAAEAASRADGAKAASQPEAETMWREVGSAINQLAAELDRPGNR